MIKNILLCFISLFLINSLYADGMEHPPSKPTNVQVGVFVTDILDLSELNENLDVNMILQYDWQDPRLAFDEKKEHKKYKLYQGMFQFNEQYSGWWPQFYILNESGTSQVNSVQIKIYSNGHVVMREGRTVKVETPMQLKKFPFDKQKLLIDIIPFGETTDDIVLKVDNESKEYIPDYIQNNPDMNIAEWNLLDYKLYASNMHEYFYGEPKYVSKITLSINLERKSSSIVWKVILPLVFLVLAMAAVFWMDSEALSDRLNLSFIGILTIVAYQFSVDSNLPNISYLTFADIFLLISFVILFSTILESLWVYRLSKKGSVKEAYRIDLIFRWIFPLGYLSVIGLLYHLLV